MVLYPPFSSTTYSQQLARWKGPPGSLYLRYEALCSSRASVVVSVYRRCETLTNRCEHRIIHEIQLIYPKLQHRDSAQQRFTKYRIEAICLFPLCVTIFFRSSDQRYFFISRARPQKHLSREVWGVCFHLVLARLYYLSGAMIPRCGMRSSSCMCMLRAGARLRLIVRHLVKEFTPCLLEVVVFAQTTEK